MNKRIIIAITTCMTINTTLAMDIQKDPPVILSIGDILAKVACNASEIPSKTERIYDLERRVMGRVQNLAENGPKDMGYAEAIIVLAKEIDIARFRVSRPMNYCFVLPSSMNSISITHGPDVPWIEQLALIVASAFQLKHHNQKLADVEIVFSSRAQQQACLTAQPGKKYPTHLSKLADRLRENGTTYLDGPLDGTASINEKKPRLNIWQMQSTACELDIWT